MGKVIRIDDYRRDESRSAEAGHEVWSCGACGESAWTVSTSGHLHCRHCDTTAANLQLEAPAPQRPAAPEPGASMPWSAFMASAQWWWTWAPQS